MPSGISQDSLAKVVDWGNNRYRKDKYMQILHSKSSFSLFLFLSLLYVEIANFYLLLVIYWYINLCVYLWQLLNISILCSQSNNYVISCIEYNNNETILSSLSLCRKFRILVYCTRIREIICSIIIYIGVISICVNHVPRFWSNIWIVTDRQNSQAAAAPRSTQEIFPQI